MFGKYLPKSIRMVFLPVDVGWDGLIGRLVHAADSQPHKAFLPFNKPAVSCYHWQPHYRQQGEPTEEWSGCWQNRWWRTSSQTGSLLAQSCPLGHFGWCDNIHQRKTSRGVHHLTSMKGCSHLRALRPVYSLHSLGACLSVTTQHGKIYFDWIAPLVVS